MIEARNLVKRYGAVEAIRGVSFGVGTGEIVGLLGPNGAGKTTIMKMLTCFHSPTSGTAIVDGHDVSSDSMAVRECVGYLPENAPVYRDLKVIEYLDFVAEIRGFRKADRKTRVERAMALCDLGSMAYRSIDKLSKGYRQRVGLAQAILHDPGTLILDEPTSGLDPNQIAEIRSLVRELGKEKTVILSTHILQEVEIMCRNVLILNRGLIVANGTAAEIGKKISGKRTVVTLTLEGVAREALLAALERLPKGCASSEPLYSSERVSLEISMEGQALEGLVSEWAVNNRFRIVGMTTKSMELEEIFRILTHSETANA